MKKKFFFIFIFVFSSVFANSYSDFLNIQVFASWVEKLQVKIILQGSLKKNWYIYSIEREEENPIATEIKFFNENWKTITFKETAPQKIYDELAQDIVAVHQKIFKMEKVILWKGDGPAPTIISGFLLFQICNQKVCSLEQKKEFEISLK